MSKKIMAVIAICFLLFQCLLWLLICFESYFTGLVVGLLLGVIVGMILVIILYTLCLKSWDKLINDSEDITEVLKKLLCIHGLSGPENAVIIQEAERKLDKLYEKKHRCAECKFKGMCSDYCNDEMECLYIPGGL